MATAKQKEAARRNSTQAQRSRAEGSTKTTNTTKPTKATRAPGLSAADKNELDDKEFAFPGDRKEPLVDANHVRNAVARFDQVEGVTDKERDQAWRRIRSAAKKFGVEIEEKSWHELFSEGRAKKRR
jgi:hypothetical protein